VTRPLGVIEMTAPDRVALDVDRGLDRLAVPKKARHYFALHTILDVKHSATWNHEILCSLVAAEPRAARPIGEGALLRLRCGGRCFPRGIPAQRRTITEHVNGRLSCERDAFGLNRHRSVGCSLRCGARSFFAHQGNNAAQLATTALDD
jgi:hypothetical protein